MVKLLALAGSLRADSYNKKLVKVAAEAARTAGAEVKYLDLRDYPLPLFDEDLEKAEGIHPNARKLKDLFLWCDGFLLSCPEYNSSITGVLKNAIDWVSRPVQGELPYGGMAGKTCALMSASPGALGGLRGLVVVRMLLGNIGVHLIPEQIAVSKAHEAISDDGKLKDPKTAAQIEGLAKTLVKVAAALSHR